VHDKIDRLLGAECVDSSFPSHDEESIGGGQQPIGRALKCCLPLDRGLFTWLRNADGRDGSWARTKEPVAGLDVDLELRR
jgi:hypothetical protein